MISWCQGSFGGFLLKSHVSALGGLTAFRDFIHRLPCKCKFISSLGANFTLQLMETTSELLWFCKGRSLWCGSIAAEKGIKASRSSHLAYTEGSKIQAPAEGSCTHPPLCLWGIPILGDFSLAWGLPGAAELIPGPGSGPQRHVPGGGCGRGPPRRASSGSQWCFPRCCRSRSPAGEADGLRAWGWGPRRPPPHVLPLAQHPWWKQGGPQYPPGFAGAGG